MCVDLFGQSRRDRSALARVKGWAAELLELAPQDSLVVNELACAEPGCPPHETVVLIARAGEPTVQLKVGKPAADVQRLDLVVAIDLQGARSS